MKSRVFKLLVFLCLPVLSPGSEGLKLRLQNKSPLILKTLDAADLSEPVPLREPLLYLGGSLTWRPVSKTAELSLAGNHALLLLEENSAYIGKKRLALPSPLHWKDGRLSLSRGSLELLFKTLSSDSPLFETASAQELKTLPPPGLVIQKTPPAEPVIVQGRGPRPTLASPLRRIFIDPGHGGHDPGAHGRGGVVEKEVCLDISIRLKKLIEQKMPGVDVQLTRENDRFVSLRERTVVANEAQADLFISIHNNASRNVKSRGSQVFFYDSRASDRAAEDLARRENDEANYLDFIMMDLGKSLIRDQSILLAQSVQDRLAEVGADSGVNSRQLSYAPFYVLARTKMPAILVEVAFISNPREEKLLKNANFRAQIAEGILAGLKTYKTELARQ